MRRLAFNTILNGAALGVSLLAQLLLVPTMIAAWGVAGLGLLAFVRIVTPLGLGAVLDAGAGLALARGVARHSARGDPDSAARWVVGGLWMALAVGSLAGLALAAVQPERVFDFLVGEEGAPRELASVWLLIALSFPLLLAGTLAQSALEGLERFVTVRAVEVAGNVGFLAAASAFSAAGASISTVLSFFLLLQAVRAVVLWLALQRTFRLAFAGWSPRSGSYRPILRECRVLYPSKLLGLANQQVPAALVALFAGAQGLGVFDAVMRIPRALKLVAGVMSSAVLPVAIRLTEHGERESRGSLLIRGSRLSVLAILPPAAALAVFGEPILGAWIGPAFEEHAILLQLSLLAVAVAVLSAFASTIAASELRLVKRMVWFSLVELVAVSAGGALLMPAYGLLGLVATVAVVAGVGYALRLSIFVSIAREQVGRWLLDTGRLIAVCVAAFFVVHVWWPEAGDGIRLPVDGMLVLLGIYAAIAVTSSRPQREDVRLLLSAAFGRRKAS